MSNFNPKVLTHPLDTRDLHEVLELCREPLKELVNQRILITGASGFVGSWLTETWCHAWTELNGGGELILLNRQKTPRQVALADGKPMVRILQHDIRAPRLAASVFDLIIHAATTASQDLNANDPSEMQSVINEGTHVVAEIALQSGCRLLNLSSGAVYGLLREGEHCFSENRVITSDSLIEGSQYHRSKIHAENLLSASRESKGLDFVNARLFAFLAPLLPIDSHFAAGNFLRDALVGDCITVRGDGSSVRSYLYGSDLASWLFTIAVKGKSGQSYNVGSPHDVSIRGLAEAIGIASRKEVCLDNEPTYGNPVYLPCIDKAKSELNLDISVGLEDSILRTMRWWEVALGIG